MNILHMKYAVEIAKCGSINKAAESLLMNQPNLSRAIKELEASLGVKIFERSAKGMIVTRDGETFLKYASNILKQVDEVEAIFKKSASNKKKFSISVPGASYISEALSNFSLELRNEEDIEIFYKETNTQNVIKNILEEGYRLGIIRYAAYLDKQYKEILEEKGLAHELVAEFRNVLVMSKDSPLAKREKITYKDLENYIEISYADFYAPSMLSSEEKNENIYSCIKRRMFVFERASQFDVLEKNPRSFVRTSPVPEKVLSRYGLVQKYCSDDTNMYKDLIIRKEDYRLTEIDGIFITELCKSKRGTF